MFTVVVVFPTPPFWLATTKTRGFSGLGNVGTWLSSSYSVPYSSSATQSSSARSKNARRGPVGVWMAVSRETFS